jgi:hypothetical protein
MDEKLTWQLLGTMSGAAMVGTLVTSCLKRWMNLNGKAVEVFSVGLTCALFVGASVAQGVRGLDIVLAVLNGLVAGAASIGINRLGTSPK